MAPNGPETSFIIREQSYKPNQVVGHDPGPGTGGRIYITADGRRWRPCDNGTQRGEVRQLVNGFMQ